MMYGKDGYPKASFRAKRGYIERWLIDLPRERRFIKELEKELERKQRRR